MWLSIHWLRHRSISRFESPCQRKPRYNMESLADMSECPGGSRLAPYFKRCRLVRTSRLKPQDRANLSFQPLFLLFFFLFIPESSEMEQFPGALRCGANQIRSTRAQRGDWLMIDRVILAWVGRPLGVAGLSPLTSTPKASSFHV